MITYHKRVTADLVLSKLPKRSILVIEDIVTEDTPLDGHQSSRRRTISRAFSDSWMASRAKKARSLS